MASSTNPTYINRMVKFYECYSESEPRSIQTSTPKPAGREGGGFIRPHTSSSTTDQDKMQSSPATIKRSGNTLKSGYVKLQVQRFSVQTRPDSEVTPVPQKSFVVRRQSEPSKPRNDQREISTHFRSELHFTIGGGGIGRSSVREPSPQKQNFESKLKRNPAFKLRPRKAEERSKFLRSPEKSSFNFQTPRRPQKLIAARSASFTSYIDEEGADQSIDTAVVLRTVEKAEIRRNLYQQQRKGCQSQTNNWRASLLQWQNVASLLPGVAYTFGFLQKLGHTEEVVMSSYGDSETESDDDEEEDEDDYDLDSVSVLDERHSNISSTQPSQPTNITGGDADSGRGNSPSCSSPASSSSSTVVSASDIGNGTGPFKTTVRNGCRNNATVCHGGKPARPISAVPSELSDISYTTSDDAGIEDEHEDIPANDISADIIIKEVETANVETSGRINEAHRIACELLSTEEQYVCVLSLIDQKFHFRVDQENRVSKMFPQEMLVQMFANIKPIYQFHAEFILPQLRERMDKWNIDPKYQKIGDIMVKFSHFFKMYTEYVKNFENARNTINILYQKNSKFAAIMDEIHALPECGNLTLQQHMLTPIQRIPRYEMLLKKYLSKLPDDSPDRADSEQALQLVSNAAAHANDAMKRTEKFKKVLEVQESLGGTVDLVSPTRELVKEGKIVKISARSGDHQDRYLFLFSDLLLLCSTRLMGNRVISRPSYRLRARFEVDNMQVLEGDNLVTANTFYIRDDHKSVELYTHTRSEKEEWLEALFQTIKDLYQKKSSLRIGREILRPSESEIGRKQPRLLKMESIQKCMDCGQPFTMMRKKHNCRACGIVVCNKCSSQKYPLRFEETKSSRVCRACFHLLNLHAEKEAQRGNAEPETSAQTSQDQPDPAIITGRDSIDAPVRPKGLLEVSANESSIMCGYMTLRASQLSLTGVVSGGPISSKSIKRWFALHRDFVLYTFKSESDSQALTATPMPGYTVLTGAELKGEPGVAEKDRDKTIKMFYAPLMTTPQSSALGIAAACRKAYFFSCSSVDEVKRWAEALKLATRAEVPLPNTNKTSDEDLTKAD